MVLEKDNLPSEADTQRKVPCLVGGEQVGLRKRLRARLSRVKLWKNVFLGYCPIHQRYYVDYQHTDGSIRCPLCDQTWIAQKVQETTHREGMASY
ncbi:hypothetical protein MUP77_21830 [Candidatus Bathyarchaeota archaeon]|nr:hypothetical protein [Candidatus Bathyarchaeota archaeon]